MRHLAAPDANVAPGSSRSATQKVSDWLDGLAEPDWTALRGRAASAWDGMRRRGAERSAARSRLRAERQEEKAREQAAREAAEQPETEERRTAAATSPSVSNPEEPTGLGPSEDSDQTRPITLAGPSDAAKLHDRGEADGEEAEPGLLPAADDVLADDDVPGTATGPDAEEDLTRLVENAREAIQRAREQRAREPREESGGATGFKTVAFPLDDAPRGSAPGDAEAGPSAGDYAGRHYDEVWSDDAGSAPRHTLWEEEDEGPIYIPPYNLPSTDPDPPETPLDKKRRTGVSAALLAALLLGLWGLGVFGGGTVQATAAFNPNFALLSPSVDSFVAWGVVFLSLAGFALFQRHPSQRSSLRQRSLGYPVAAAGLLGALWLLAARAGLVGISLWIAMATTGLLVYCLRLLNERTARNQRERLLMDAPVGVYLGWMLTVLPMNAAAWLTAHGIDLLLPAGLWAAFTVVAATWAACSFSMTERGRIAVAFGFGWGMFWVMMQRLMGSNDSASIALLCGLCAFIVLLATENRRHQIGHAERRAARGQRTEF